MYAFVMGIMLPVSWPCFMQLDPGPAPFHVDTWGGGLFVRELQATADISYVNPAGMGRIATVSRALFKLSSDSRAPRCSPSPAQPVLVRMGPSTRTPRSKTCQPARLEPSQQQPSSQKPLGRDEKHVVAKAATTLTPSPTARSPAPSSSRAGPRACRRAPSSA